MPQYTSVGCHILRGVVTGWSSSRGESALLGWGLRCVGEDGGTGIEGQEKLVGAINLAFKWALAHDWRGRFVEVNRILHQCNQQGPLCPLVWGAHEWAWVLSPWPSHFSSLLSLPPALVSAILSSSSNFAERPLPSIWTNRTLPLFFLNLLFLSFQGRGVALLRSKLRVVILSHGNG